MFQKNYIGSWPVNSIGSWLAFCEDSSLLALLQLQLNIVLLIKNTYSQAWLLLQTDYLMLS